MACVLCCEENFSRALSCCSAPICLLCSQDLLSMFDQKKIDLCTACGERFDCSGPVTFKVFTVLEGFQRELSKQHVRLDEAKARYNEEVISFQEIDAQLASGQVISKLPLGFSYYREASLKPYKHMLEKWEQKLTNMALTGCYPSIIEEPILEKVIHVAHWPHTVSEVHPWIKLDVAVHKENELKVFVKVGNRTGVVCMKDEHQRQHTFSVVGGFGLIE